MLLKWISLGAALSAVAVMFLGVSPWWMVPVFALAWVLLLAVAVAVLFILCSRVDMDQPQEEDDPFYRKAMYLYVELLMSLAQLKVQASGLEKVPTDGRFLLVCNHQNEADPGVLLHFFRGSQLAFISKKENRDMIVVGKFMHKTLCQMVDRENDREALKTILKCIQMIKEDKVSVAVFPEGGIKERDKLNPFRPGVFKIAQKTGVPIVVCTLKGTSSVFEKLRKLQPIPVELNLVEVIPAGELKGLTTVQVAQRVYDSMLADLGESWKLDAED